MRDYFYCLIFPHPSNNHRAKALHFKTFFIVISLLILGAFFFSSDINPFTNNLKVFADISTQELLNFTNQKRAEFGLPALALDQALEIAASKKADDMFAKNYWAHNSPDGTTPWFFITQAGYEYVYAGENLARGFTDSQDAVNAWMASTEHRENILSENFKDVGFAVKAGTLNGEETFLIVQEFGNKTSAPVVAVKKAQSAPVAENSSGLSFANLTTRPSFSFSYEFMVILIFGFIAILIIDLIFVQRNKIVRFVGHNMDHVLFLFAIIIIITLFSTGVII
jgi:uncharacterized protein YkwD